MPDLTPATRRVPPPAEDRRPAAAKAAVDRRGHDVVVPQPTCGYVLKQDYPRLPRGADAELVAAQHPRRRRVPVGGAQGRRHRLDTEFTGTIPETITYHAPCHLRAQNIGLKSRDLLKLTGAKITVVAECSGIDGTWGLARAELRGSRKVAKKMADADRQGRTTTSWPATATWPTAASSKRPASRPCTRCSSLARAYGIPEEPRR